MNLHPAPDDYYVDDRGRKLHDHRDHHNRQQMNDGNVNVMMVKRVVEQLADELQVSPMEAYRMLRDGFNDLDIGIAWMWWT